MADILKTLSEIASIPRVRIPPTTELHGEIVPMPPAKLAEEAGIDLQTYALGRLVESEYGGGPPAALVAIAQIAINRARTKGLSVAAMLTQDLKSGESGFFGRQRGRWASTSLDPTKRSIAAARVAQLLPDLSAGAMRFFDPKVQDRGMQAGKPLELDAIGVIKKWGQEGWRWIVGAPLYQYGVDPYQLMVLGKATNASATVATVQDAIRMVLHNRETPRPKRKAPESV